VLSSASNALNGGIYLNEGTLQVSAGGNLGPNTNPIYCRHDGSKTLAFRRSL
jgi:autotransporter-associated beta strand protein